MATILVLEKDPVEAWALQAELMMNGDHHVLIDDDPQRALKRVFREECELIIADWVNVDGNLLCQQLRKLRPGHNIPIIIVGIQQPMADANTIEHILRKQYGCDDYIPKPFDVQKLAQLVDVLLLRRKIKEDILSAPNDDPHNES